MQVKALDPKRGINEELLPGFRRIAASGTPASNDVGDDSSHEFVAGSSWCCLRCRRNEETLTAAQLRWSLGAEVFCPRIRFRQVTQKTRLWVSEPLFPGYFFARLDPRWLEQTNRFSDVLVLGDRYAVAPNELIEKLKYHTRATETGDLRSVLIPGERWRGLDDFVDGPDIIILEILPGRERIARLLEFLQQPAGEQLSDDNLFLAAASGFALLKFATRVRIGPSRRRLGRASTVV
jgi:transcriptional antiterminator RfaH